MIQRRFADEGAVERAYNIVMETNGIQRTLDLAKSHSVKAIESIDKLGDTDVPEAIEARQALKQLAEMVISRRK